MIVLVPLTHNGIGKIENNLAEFMDFTTVNVKVGLVKLSLPLFKVTSSVDLKNHLTTEVN